LPKLPFKEVIEVSAHERVGLNALLEAIDRLIWREKDSKREEVVITSLRHKEALSQALVGVQKTIDGLTSGVSAEFVAFDARFALHHLGTIIGTNITEDVLSAIFSKFCIGK
jgi:tRNA modification GTPase